MSVIIPIDVLCCCGWRGRIPTRANCPGCNADPGARVTKERLDKLRAVQRGERVFIPANMRSWFVRRGLMAMTPVPARKMRSPSANRPRVVPVLTGAGARVIAVAGAKEMP